MAATAGDTAKVDHEPKPSTSGSSVLVVDIRKRQSRKRIRRLRKGGGSLMDKVNDTIQELRQQNAIGANVQPVVFVVRQKSRRWRMGGPLGL
jgi:hypothetical protein